MPHLHLNYISELKWIFEWHVLHVETQMFYVQNIL